MNLQEPAGIIDYLANNMHLTGNLIGISTQVLCSWKGRACSVRTAGGDCCLSKMELPYYVMGALMLASWSKPGGSYGIFS